MFEMSAAELEAEMGVELPDREVMHSVRINRSFNRNNVIAFGSITQTATAKNVNSDYSTATAVNAVVFMQNSGTIGD